MRMPTTSAAATRAALKEAPSRRGVDPARLARLKSPAGFDLVAISPEIALSILAEMWRCAGAAIGAPRHRRTDETKRSPAAAWGRTVQAIIPSQDRPTDDTVQWEPIEPPSVILHHASRGG